MIRVIFWNGRVTCLGGVELLPANLSELSEGAVLWIDLENPTPEEEDRVLKQFLPVHPLSLEDITKQRREPEQGPHLPKVEEFPDYLFVIVNPLPNVLIQADTQQQTGKLNLKRKERPQLSAVLSAQVLVTHHYASMLCVADCQKLLQRHTENIGRGPDYVFHLILDGIVDEYSPVVERLSEQLDRVEVQMFRKPTQLIMTKLLHLKRQVSYLRKTMILEREVLARLIRGEFKLVEEREIVYYRNVYDHLVRYTELIESAREMVSDLLQSHLAVMSNKLNEIMKTLTMISTTILPMTLISGIYGMNFKHMPELEWELGFAFALSLMAIAGVGAFFLFRWKKWI